MFKYVSAAEAEIELLRMENIELRNENENMKAQIDFLAMLAGQADSLFDEVGDVYE